MRNPYLVKVRVIAFGTPREVWMHPTESFYWLLERALTLSDLHRDEDAGWRRLYGRGWELLDGAGQQVKLGRLLSEETYREPFILNEPVGVDG